MPGIFIGGTRCEKCGLEWDENEEARIYFYGVISVRED